MEQTSKNRKTTDMANPLLWLAMALFPNGRIANRPVKVSRREYRALLRENAESSERAMGETIEPAFNRTSIVLEASQDWAELHAGRRLDGSLIDDPREYPKEQNK